MNINDFGGFICHSSVIWKKKLQGLIPYENKQNIQYNFKDLFYSFFIVPQGRLI